MIKTTESKRLILSRHIQRMPAERCQKVWKRQPAGWRKRGIPWSLSSYGVVKAMEDSTLQEEYWIKDALEASMR